MLLDGATPNVVTEDGLRELLSDGIRIESNLQLDCREAPRQLVWLLRRARRDKGWPGCEDACHKPQRLQIARVQDDRRTRQFPCRYGGLSASIPLTAGRRERQEASGSPATATR